MQSSDLHFEPFVHLAGLSHNRALLAWGGFFFRRDTRGDSARWLLVDDEEFVHVHLQRTESIGERAESYGPARVRVFDEQGRCVADRKVTDRNHVWIEDLEPDHTYCYDIHVNDKPWLAGERYDWLVGPDGRRGLYPSSRQYDCRFRTYPPRNQSAPLTFAAFGDYGVGISSDREDSRRQRQIAQALERAVDAFDVRLVITLGDNIYHGPNNDGSGDEDDDWYFTFYQPYRYLISRIPFYVTVGNHDSADQEKSDDRDQLEDNFYLAQRFGEKLEADKSDFEPGLFYSFRYGADIEFVSIDTTCAEHPYFTRPAALQFLKHALCDDVDDVRWHIPFSHHPMYCAGPEHLNTDEMEPVLTPLFKRSGVRLALAGHEHNFQHACCDGIHYIVTGAGGKLRTDLPDHFEDAHIVDWTAQGHFVVVQIDSEHARVRPLSADEHGDFHPLVRETPEGEKRDQPIMIALS